MTDTSPGVFFAFGGILMILGSLGEWIIGNTFPFVVFGTFGKLPLVAPTSTREANLTLQP